MVPDLTYNDLAIVDGQVASVEIARLLFVAHKVRDRDQLRRDLLAYCERDTWAMVRLLGAAERDRGGDGLVAYTLALPSMTPYRLSRPLPSRQQP